MLQESLPPGHEIRMDLELRSMRLRLLLDPSLDLTGEAAELQQRADRVGSDKLSATALYVRGLAHAAHGDDARALPMIERATRTMQHLPQSFPHDSLAWFATLAEVRSRMGDAAGAERARRDALAYAAKWHVPRDHPALAALRSAAIPASGNRR